MLKRSSLRQKWALMKQYKAAYALMAPFSAIFFTFTILPVFISVVLSFTHYNVLQAPEFVGFENYRKLLVDDEVFSIAVKNTLIFALVTGPIGYLLSFFASWAINDFNRYIKSILTFIFYVPTISGTVYTIWGILFSGDMYGYVNSALMRLGIISEPIEWFTTDTYVLWLIIIVQLWMSMGTGFLAMRAGTATVDPQYYEAAAIDGVKNRVQEVFYITIPLMAPHLMTAAVLQITAMFANTTVSMNLAGFPSTNYSGHLIMTHMLDYSVYRVERGYACAIAALLFVFMITINQIILRALRKVGT